jgi:hypothetical protein
MDCVRKQDLSKQRRTALNLRVLVVVPYTNNPRFIGRSDTLEKLKSLLGPSLKQTGTGSHARAALFGLGGIGYA